MDSLDWLRYICKAVATGAFIKETYSTQLPHFENRKVGKKEKRK